MQHVTERIYKGKPISSFVHYLNPVRLLRSLKFFLLLKIPVYSDNVIEQKRIMLGYLVLLACLATCMATMGVPVLKNCTGRYNVPSQLLNMEMKVSDCDDPSLCYLIRNTTHTVKFRFGVSQNTRKLNMEVYGQVMRVRVPYVRKVDLCKSAMATDGTPCLGNGLIVGKVYEVDYEFYIRARFPEWRVPVEFELTDGTKKLGCSQIEVKIQCNILKEKSCKKT